MTENFDLFLLLASKNVPHIFDKIFSGVGAVTLVNLSAASAVICADTGVPFSPGRRLVRIYCRRRRVLLSVCPPWPQHALTALLLHN